MKNSKYICVILALILAFVTIGAAVLCAVRLDHDCKGESCSVCRAIHSVLGQSRAAAAMLLAAVFAAAAAAYVLHTRIRLPSRRLTPVGLFVKLTE